MKNKTLNILFYNSKGAMGKTTHAVSLANFLGASFYTNDIGKSTLQIYKKLLKNGKELKPNEEIEIDDEESNIFDFGGFLDKRVIEVAKFVDWCIVPICYQSSADLAPSLQSITELEKYNKNIIILINNTGKEYVNSIKQNLSIQFKYPIFIINKSKFVNWLPNENLTIFGIHELGGLERYSVKDIHEQFKNFYAFLQK